MDERKLRLKQLKKACKKAKRKLVTPWKIFGIFFLLLAILLSVVTGAVMLYGETIVTTICDKLSINADALLTGIPACDTMPLRIVCELPLDTKLLAVAIVLWVLYVIMLALWIRGKKKWKKSEAYLDYRTLKSTMKQEKQK